MQYSAWFGNRFARYRGRSRQLAVRLWRRCKELIQSHLDHHGLQEILIEQCTGRLLNLCRASRQCPLPSRLQGPYRGSLCFSLQSTRTVVEG